MRSGEVPCRLAIVEYFTAFSILARLSNTVPRNLVVQRVEDERIMVNRVFEAHWIIFDLSIKVESK